MACKKPCAECPFRKGVKPGGIQQTTAFIGQALGPFMLPCHMSNNYMGDDEKERRTNTQKYAPCAGAAMYRKAMGYPDYAGRILHLEPDDSVHRTPEELLSAQGGMSLRDATLYLKHVTVAQLCDRELYTALTLRAQDEKGE